MEIRNLGSEGGASGAAFDNSAVIRRALESLRDAGGGSFVIPRGIWMTGPVELYSQTTLVLEEGAVLSFIPDPELYRPVKTRWEGIDCFAMRPCLFSSGQSDIAVTGKGRLDGNGRTWWDMLNEKRSRGQSGPELPIERKLAELNPEFLSQPGGGGGRELQFLRPPLVQFQQCSDVRILGVSLSNSPFWTLHPLYCDGVLISGVHIANPHDAPNTDGIDIDSSCSVEISGCDISVGDDGIALKSGSGPDGIRTNRPTSHVVVRGCTVRNGHGGVVIGSETAAGIHDVLAEDCVFRGTDRGIRIKTRRGRGGEIADLVFRNLVMEGNLCPLAVNMYYRCGARPDDEGIFSLEEQPVVAETPRIRRISVSGIRASGCRASAGFIVGLPESPVEGLVVSDSVFSTDEDSSVPPAESDMFLGLPQVDVKSFRLRFASAPVFDRVEVRGPEKPFIEI